VRAITKWILLALLLPISAWSADQAAWERVDRHALAAPAAAERNIASLAAYLGEGAHSEEDKIRAIYRWLADRIEYDVEVYLAGRENEYANISPEAVLASRRAVCHGYAALFSALAGASGIEVATVLGYAKAYARAGDQGFREPNHSWNVIKTQGKWQVIDTTWGAGYVFRDRYVKKFDEFYFLPSLSRLRFTHLPAQAHVGHPISMSKAEFEALPAIDPGLFRAGVSGDLAWDVAHRPGFRSFVRTYEQNQRDLQIREAPLEEFIPAKQPRRFDYETESFEEITVAHDGGWVKLTRQGKNFSGLVPVRPGGVLIMGRPIGESRYTGLFQYTAE